MCKRRKSREDPFKIQTVAAVAVDKFGIADI